MIIVIFLMKIVNDLFELLYLIVLIKFNFWNGVCFVFLCVILEFFYVKNLFLGIVVCELLESLLCVGENLFCYRF